jgi:hypothetical protein
VYQLAGCRRRLGLERLAFGQDPGGAFKTGATALAPGHAPGRALEERRAWP